MNVKTVTYPAPKELNPFVDGIWFTAMEGPSHELSSIHCCLPTGNRELIFNITPQRFCTVFDGEQHWMPHVVGYSVNGSPVYWQAKGGTIIFGVVVMPQVLEWLTNGETKLKEVIYEDMQDFGQPLFDEILEHARRLETFSEIATMVFDRMRRYLVQFREADSQLPYYSQALRLLRQHSTPSNLDEISGQVYVSKRQLQRLFLDKLGYGPKTYSRILRFSDALNFIGRHPEKKLTEVAYDFGYADQSHFIREFKDFTGQNPKAFFSNWKLFTNIIPNPGYSGLISAEQTWQEKFHLSN